MIAAMIGRKFAPILGLAIALGFASCGSKRAADIPLGNWEKEAALVASTSTSTPSHSLPKTEYPFDDQGNYIASWAARGESRFGHKINSAYANHTPSTVHKNTTRTWEPAPRHAPSVTPAPRHVSKPVVASATPSPKPTSASTATPTPAKKSLRYHKVLASDTLYGLSRKYSTTVEKIQSVNGLTSTKILTGSTIKIPG